MSDKTKVLLVKYTISVAVGALLAYMVIDLHGFAAAGDNVTRYKILCDAFTVPGIVLIMFGVLMFLSKAGILDGVGYVFSYAVKLLIPGTRKDMLNYGDYVESRREKSKDQNFWFLIITGAAFIALALVFYALFYSVY